MAAVPRPIPAASLDGSRGQARGNSRSPGVQPLTLGGSRSDSGDRAGQGIGAGVAVTPGIGDVSSVRGAVPRGGQGRSMAPDALASVGAPSAPSVSSVAPPSAGSGIGRRDSISRPRASGGRDTSGASLDTLGSGDSKSGSAPPSIVVRNQDVPRGAGNRPVTYPFVPRTEAASPQKSPPVASRPASPSRVNNSVAPTAPRSAYVPGPPTGSGSRSQYGVPSIPTPAAPPSGGYSRPSYSAPPAPRIESVPRSYSAPTPSSSGSGNSAGGVSGGGGSSRSSRGSESGGGSSPSSAPASPGSFGPVGRGR